MQQGAGRTGAPWVWSSPGSTAVPQAALPLSGGCSHGKDREQEGKLRKTNVFSSPEHGQEPFCEGGGHRET